MPKNAETISEGSGSMQRKHFPLSFKQKVNDEIEQGNISEEVEQQI
jgi:hypothetical protein